MVLITRKTFLILMVGVMFGLLLSPIMWLQYFSPDPLANLNMLNPLCKEYPKKVSTEVIRQLSRLNRTESLQETFDPELSHNKTKLSKLELERTMGVPGNADTRKRKLFDELATRKLVFVGVITAQKYLATRALGIWRTWGQEMPDIYFFSSQPDKHGLDLPIITLPGINDTQYPPQRKVYRMLKYMHDHYIDEYDFFMRSDDDVYVKSDRLIALLQAVNPAQDIYMGCPGFGRPDDMARIKLKQKEHYCMGGPGVIFSRSALRKLAPHLETCLETVVVSYNEDVEVGRCVSQMLQLQCTWSWETSIIFWTDYKRIIPTPDLYDSDSVKKAITLHPLKDPNLMYRMHQYAQELKIKRIMNKASFTQAEVERITKLIPQKLSHFELKKWLWYYIGTNPSSRYEVSIWEYFNSTRQFLTFEHMPVIGLPRSLKTGVNTALEVLLDIMNEQDGSSHPFLPPYHLYDGFSTIDYSSGVQYSLHMSVHQKDVTDPQEYIANVFLPFHGAGMVSYMEAEAQFSTIIHLIVNVGQSTDVTKFLQMYEEVCLKPNLQTHLHVVISGSNKKASSSVSQLMVDYSHDVISKHKMRAANTSVSEAYRYVANSLNDGDLIVLFDSSFDFTSEFLDHCRMNTVRGRQIFSPILFSFYKPELVKKHLQRSPQAMISADTGFFLRYNYQVVSLYKSDYVAISESQTSTQSKGHLNEDVMFIDKALSTKVYIMRSLEPYLRRFYHPRICKGLSGNARLACMNSRADTIGSKKILGSIVVSHDLLDTI